MDALAPCPFCGETTEFRVMGGTPGTPVAFVVCGTCHTRGPGGESSNQAVANWNRRPTSTLGDLRGIHRAFAKPGAVDWTGDVSKDELLNLAEADAAGIDDIAVARERRELAGLPSIKTTTGEGGVGMDFDMFGAPPPPKPPKR